MKKISLHLVWIIIFLSVSLWGQIPRQMTYQGYLTDNSNNPITGNLQLTFTLYDALSGGNTLWEEIHFTVPIINGSFRVLLGSDAPLNLPFRDRYWLGIKVGNDPELAPRIPLTPVGYSFYSLKADSVDNLGAGSVSTDKIEDGAVTQAKLAPGLSLPPGGVAGGDLAGNYPNPTVDGLRGRGISNTSPASGQVLKWNGTSWAPAPDSTGSSVWQANGNNIYNINSGYVGIGTSSPSDKLQAVDGDRSGNLCFGYLTGSGISLRNHYGGLRGSYTADVYGEIGKRNSGVLLTSYLGVYAYSAFSHTGTNYGIYGYAANAGTNYAGYFSGDVNVSGNLSKAAGSFKIDHPLDPQNKYLYHSFVESPDMMNIYNGNVVLDEKGEAWVELPEWFEALNQDFRYQLTCIGGFSQVYIAQEISGNRFKIAGGTQNLKVSWQVTGIRHDAYAQKHRIPVEVKKTTSERGKYLHPEAFGLSEESGIDYEMNRPADKNQR